MSIPINEKEEGKQMQNQNTNRKPTNQDAKQVKVAALLNNNNNQKKKRKPKDFAPFGNYRNYYGYRIGQDMEEDPRLKVLRKEWFEDKDCLDIGCNNGLITIQIAKKFHCRNILGVDIDSDRIEDAKWNLRNAQKNLSKTHSNASKSEVVDGEVLENKMNTSLDGDTREALSVYSSTNKRSLTDTVTFRRENFVQSERLPPGKCYDTIICLSVTKWVHLNWGDDGLITLFTKIWKLLNPGGIFVLEPQPWRSYENNRQTTEITAANYHKITFPPNHFQHILLDKIGFRSVEDVTSGLSGSKTGFNRPVLVFRK